MILDPFRLALDELDGDPNLARWRRDPAAWARERLGVHLWSVQEAVADSVATNRRTAVKSSHGIGKSWVAAMLTCWWIDVHPPGEAVVVTTAPTAKQVSAVLWREIRQMHRKGGLPGRVTLDNEWKLDDDDLVGLGRKPADHDDHGFQGIHRRYVLAILDEACGIPANLYTAVEAITTNADCRILAIGNPDDPATEFGTVCKPGSGWTVLTVPVFDSPNFTGEPVPEVLRHLLPSPEWVEDARKRWGEGSPLWQSKVLGEFPDISTDTLIPARWITAAQNRDIAPGRPATLGVDVARFGTDQTILALRRGSHARILTALPHSATTETTGHVMLAQREHGNPTAHVDGVGVGGGVVDMLRAAGVPVADLQAGSGATDSERFKNARAEWYWGLRERFEAGDIDLDPNDDELASQLASIQFSYTARGQIVIESKDDMAKRGMPSPDRADALMLAFATTTRRKPLKGSGFFDIG